MQERDQELIDEDRMEQSGYFDWRNDNIGDLKAEFLNNENKLQDLIQHFYWDEKTMEDYWNENSDELEEYVKEAYEGFCDVRDTERSLQPRL